jgi:hypothetical protein
MMSIPTIDAYFRALGTNLQVGLEALKVETNGLFVKVAVAPDLESRVTEDGGVVAPGGDRKVDDLGVRVMTGKECGTNPKRAGAGDRLRNSDGVRGQRRAIRAIRELGRVLGEFRETSDGKVLLVWVGGGENLLSLLVG